MSSAESQFVPLPTSEGFQRKKKATVYWPGVSLRAKIEKHHKKFASMRTMTTQPQHFAGLEDWEAPLIRKGVQLCHQQAEGFVLEWDMREWIHLEQPENVRDVAQTRRPEHEQDTTD